MPTIAKTIDSLRFIVDTEATNYSYSKKAE